MLGGEVINGIYYSSFPNQQFLLLVESWLFKLNNSFGVIDTGEGLMTLIIFQCILMTLTGNVLYRIIYDYLRSDGFAWLGWVTFGILVALSGVGYHTIF